MATSEGREEVVKRLQGPPLSTLSSGVLMPQEPDLLWDVLTLELRHAELQANLKKADGTVAFSIAQEIRQNRQKSTELLDRLGLTGADLIALSHDTAPALMSLSFGPIDADAVEVPPRSTAPDDFMVSVRGRGMSFATEISARLEFKLAGTLRSQPLVLSRRTEDWEYTEFTAQRSLADLGFVVGTEAAVLLEMTLGSERTVTRCLMRFVSE